MSDQKGPYPRGNKVVINIMLDPDQVKPLDELTERRRTSRSQLIREAIDEYLARHAEKAVA